MTSLLKTFLAVCASAVMLPPASFSAPTVKAASPARTEMTCAVRYEGRQTGLVHVVFLDGRSALTRTYPAPGRLTVTDLPPGKAYRMNAFRDSNGNGDVDFWEAQAAQTNVIQLVAGMDAGTLVLVDPDTDMDMLPDYWELRWFDDLKNDGFHDPDYDGVSNFEECVKDSDPVAPALTRLHYGQDIMSWNLVPSIPAMDYEAKPGQVLYSEVIEIPALQIVEQWDKLIVATDRLAAPVGWSSTGLLIRVNGVEVPAHQDRGTTVGEVNDSRVTIELVYTGGGKVALTKALYLLKWSPRVSIGP